MDSLITAALGGGLAIAAGLLARRYPRAAIIGFMVAFAFVPIWLGASVGLYVAASTGIAGVIAVFLLPGTRFAFAAPDWCVALLAVIAAIGWATGGTTASSGYTVLGTWIVGYLLGRLVTTRVPLPWVAAVIAVVMTAAAGLAIVEFLAHWNPFVTIRGPGPSWSIIQVRGGVARAEGAFGHSIALGCSIALSIPIMLGSRLPFAVRLGMLLVMCGGVVVTFSRISMICAAIAVVASVLLLRESFRPAQRALMIVAGIALVGIVTPLVLTTFTDAGDEAAGSAAYRGDLLSLVEGMSPLGLTEDAYRSADGTASYGGFQSIDNAMIYYGLNQGWMPLALALTLLVAAVIAVLSGRATGPVIAIAAQVPALATVALITQYGLFFWIVAGLAVSSLQLRARAAAEDPAVLPASPDLDWTRVSDPRRSRGARVPRQPVPARLETERS